MMESILWSIFIGGVLSYIYIKLKAENISKKIEIAVGVLTLVMFIVVVKPYIEKAYFNRNRYVNISSRSIYDLNMESEYKRIREKLKLEGFCKIEDFRMSFSDKGNIEELNYTIVSRNRGNMLLYNVFYRSTDKQRYRIKPIDVNQWLQYDRLINEDLFFESYRKLKLDELLRNREVGTYSLSCRGDYMFSGFDNYDYYKITDEGIIGLEKSEVPEKSYSFLFNEIYGDFKKSVKMEFIIPINPN